MITSPGKTNWCTSFIGSDPFLPGGARRGSLQGFNDEERALEDTRGSLDSYLGKEWFNFEGWKEGNNFLRPGKKGLTKFCLYFSLETY